MIFQPRSLRAKLLLASVFVEVVMLSLLVVNSLRLTNASLLDQAQVLCLTTTSIDSELLGQRQFDLAVLDGRSDRSDRRSDAHRGSRTR